MSIEVRLPDLGDSVTHAKVTTWFKREGDRVSAGELIAEVETDKISVEIEAPRAGILETIYRGEGADRLPANALLALIVDDITADLPAIARSLSAPEAAAQSDVSRESPVVEGRPVPVQRVEPHDESGSEVIASPLARRMAYAAGISLAGITGSGQEGRITKSDIDAVLRRARSSSKRS